MKKLIFTIATLCSIQAAFACTAGFFSSISGNTANFSNTSTPPAPLPPTSYSVTKWNFGDGVSGYGNSHTYAGAGTYVVGMRITWTDSATNAVVCTDSIAHTVSVGSAPNEISGGIYFDSTITGITASTIFKVWLIQYNATTQDLSAIDSVTLPAYNNYYSFSNEPAGSYRVKAMLTNGASSGTSLIPTYGLDSIYWHGAQVFTYSGTGASGNHNINMQAGTATTGPGFIAGNVTMGANKSTQTTGINAPNVEIILENAAGKPLAYQVTNAVGHYSFANLPAGTYKVYPEVLGCTTTPSIVTIGAAPVSNVNFAEHTISKTVTPSNVGVASVAESNFSVFPNPSRGIINITWAAKTPAQNVRAIVTDVAGRKVLQTELNFNAATDTQVDLSHLNAGIYFINFNGEGVNYINKVVLQK
jgi:hypothetical protein